MNKNVEIIITHKFYKKNNIMIVNLSGKYWEIYMEQNYIFASCVGTNATSTHLQELAHLLGNSEQ